jgi:hypothetical protein
MSSLTTTSITTANGATNLTLRTGNTSGPSVLVTSGTDIVLRANTSANVFIANSSSIRANAAMTVANTLTVTSPLTANVLNVTTVNSAVTFSNTATFSGNVIAGVVNATSFNLGTSSIATSGFSRLPNGLLIQWGTVAVNSTSGSITFTTAFAAAPYSVQVTTTQTGNAEQAAVTAVTTTTATVRSSRSTTAATQYYLAIGV